MIKKEVTEYFLKQAEIGEWEKLNIEDVEKKFDIKNNNLKKKIPEKIYFLTFYDENINNKVLNSISSEDFNISNSEEIIQEYMMNKLEFMTQDKLALSNIINFYYKSPKFILLSLQNVKKSIKLFLKEFTISNNIIKKKLLEKSLIIVWLIATKQWLYESEYNNSSYAVIDKGIKRIKKSTSLLDDIKKK